MGTTVTKILRDIPLGSIVSDRDGDYWVRIQGGALTLLEQIVFWVDEDLDDAEVEFGPFLPADPEDVFL